MKLTRQNVGRAVDQPDPSALFYLFYGPDDAQSRALGARLVQSLSASRFLMSSSSVKSDPALLADEASAMNLFGGRRAIWIEPAGDEIAAGVEALLEGAASENPVIAIAGALRKTSALVKLAEGSPRAVAFAAYLPEGAEADRMVIDVGRTLGLKIAPPVAARVAGSCANDQAVVLQELTKLALYLDASTLAPKELDQDALDAVGAELAGSDAPRLADFALSGNVAGVIEDMTGGGAAPEAIPVVRALQRRLLMLAPARARMEAGQSLDAVMTSLGKSLFWKDKALFGKLLTTWDAKGLATVAERTGKLERALIFGPAPDRETLGEELLAIARSARGRS